MTDGIIVAASIVLSGLNKHEVPSMQYQYWAFCTVPCRGTF